jgi:hypothetical protein
MERKLEMWILEGLILGLTLKKNVAVSGPKRW